MQPKEEVRARITASTGGVYVVTAWRQISREEAVAAIRAFVAAAPNKTPKCGQEVVVRTIIGHPG